MGGGLKKEPLSEMSAPPQIEGWLSEHPHSRGSVRSCLGPVAELRVWDHRRHSSQRAAARTVAVAPPRPLDHRRVCQLRSTDASQRVCVIPFVGTTHVERIDAAFLRDLGKRARWIPFPGPREPLCCCSGGGSGPTSGSDSDLVRQGRGRGRGQGRGWGRGQGRRRSLQCL